MFDDRPMDFGCGKCGTQWSSADYPEGNFAHDGYNCPNCHSDDIYGKDPAESWGDDVPFKH